ncbi:MAG: RDD family protein [Pyrinomonadaceae bacterium]|nr:RDD family protein [Pyrinomonadaceae bacterium]
MVNDSIREELETKITPLNKIAAPADPPKPIPRGKPSMPKPSNQIKLKPSPKPITTKRSATAEIITKKTNRTLVDFQAKNSKLPEWRLQLQNAVQKRYKNSVPAESGSGIGVAMALSTNDAAALKSEKNRKSESQTGNHHLARALKRIESSRNKYYIPEKEPVRKKTKAAKTKKPFPYTIAGRTEPAAKAKETPAAKTATDSKPKLVPDQRQTKKNLYDTSELDPNFIPAKISTSLGKPNPTLPFEEEEVLTEIPVAKKTLETEIESESIEEIDDIATEESELIEDIAPFAVRFNSGIFDLIIGSFTSLILLAPFMLIGGSWFTVAGAFAFIATCAIVMFIYLTTTIGLFGKTFGMQLFSIEMIDINGEEYPTFHQAAVSSSVYLLSLAFGGIGFLTTLIDEEGRAVHDLVSATIVVKEI